MNWFNPYGLVIIAAFMVPNILFAVKCKDGFDNLWQNKLVATLEQVGRFGCFGLMIINLPYTYFGFWFDEGLTVYLAVNALLTAAYCTVWAVCFHRNSVFRALALSILPSIIFLFSGVMLVSIPLLLAALLFAPCHILLSYKNASLAKQSGSGSESRKSDGTDLPGYRKKSFSLPFRGGDIWVEHLDGMYEHTELAIQKLAADWLTWKRPSSPALLAVNLEETQLSDALFQQITSKLLSPEKRLMRVVFVGVRFADAKKLKNALGGAGFALHFENDFEKAKEWLVCS